MKEDMEYCLEYLINRITIDDNLGDKPAPFSDFMKKFKHRLPSLKEMSFKQAYFADA